MPFNKLFHKTAESILDIVRAFLGVDNTATSALFILRRIAFLEHKNTTQPLSIEQQVFFIFANRMIIDAQSALLLAKKGYYGTGYSVTAIMLRSLTMYASLVSDNTSLNDFWNEEKDTYQNDPNFFNTFKEGAIRTVAKSKFGKDAFEKSELEKLMHGSCYAIRKYYSKKQIDSAGKSHPLLMFGKFEETSKENGVRSIAGAIILDFLGIFFTEYKEKERKGYEKLLNYYYVVIKRIQEEVEQQDKELKKQGK